MRLAGHKPGDMALNCWRWCINQIGPFPGFFDLQRPATASEAGLFAAPRADLASPKPLSATPVGACLPYASRAAGGYAARAGIICPEPGRIAGGRHGANWSRAGRINPARAGRATAGGFTPGRSAPIRSRLDAIMPGRVAPFPPHLRPFWAAYGRSAWGRAG